MTAPLVRALERFLLPNACVACERAVAPQAPDALLCGLCRLRCHRIGPGCARCQQPLPPIGPCRFCRDWPERLRIVRSAVWLDEIARRLVHHLKYDGLARAARDAAGLMTRLLPPAARPALLVPIPLSARRRRARGYNQAAALARELAARWRLPVAERLVRRVRETATQTALSPEARAQNVTGAFTAAPPPAGERSYPTVILVDDVLTTGATLVAGATALGEAGWPVVDAVTFARAQPFERRVA
jgi:ComF family protein